MGCRVEWTAQLAVESFSVPVQHWATPRWDDQMQVVMVDYQFRRAYYLIKWLIGIGRFDLLPAGDAHDRIRSNMTRLAQIPGEERERTLDSMEVAATLAHDKFRSDR